MRLVCAYGIILMIIAAETPASTEAILYTKQWFIVRLYHILWECKLTYVISDAVYGSWNSSDHIDVTIPDDLKKIKWSLIIWFIDD
jgi:hypothetical protein